MNKLLSIFVTAIFPFSADAYVFGLNSVGTYTIDPVTGDSQLLASFNVDRSGGGLAYGGDMLFGLNSVGTYTIDPVTGVSQLLASFHVDGSRGGLAYGVVPLPPAMWLFLSGLVGLAHLGAPLKSCGKAGVSS